MTIKLNFNLKIFLLITLLILPYFCPSYLLNTFELIKKLVFYAKHAEIEILLVLLLLKNKKINKINYTFVFLIMFYISLLFTCLLNNISLPTYVNNVINVIGPLMIIFIFAKKYSYELILAFLTYFEIIIFINFISIILYPETGIFSIKTFITTDVYEKYDYWFLGIDNLHVTYFFPAMIFSLIYSLYNSKRISLRTIFLFVIIAISAIIRWSATTIVFLFLLTLFLVFRNIIQEIKIFNAITYIVFILILNFSIVFLKIQNLFSHLIIDILKKDLTFTNRVYIWDDTLYYINNKLLFGYGYESELVRYAKGITFHSFHAHNLLLELLYTGGIVAFILFLAVIFSSALNLKKSNSNLSSLLAFFMLIFFCISLTEVYNLFLLFLIVGLSCFCKEINEDIYFRKERKVKWKI